MASNYCDKSAQNFRPGVAMKTFRRWDNRGKQPCEPARGKRETKMQAKPIIGEVLKQARVRKKLTADDVAARCNVTRSMVYQWEASRYILPKNFEKLSEALGVSIRRLRSLNGKRFLIAA